MEYDSKTDLEIISHIKQLIDEAEAKIKTGERPGIIFASNDQGRMLICRINGSDDFILRVTHDITGHR